VSSCQLIDCTWNTVDATLFWVNFWKQYEILDPVFIIITSELQLENCAITCHLLNLQKRLYNQIIILRLSVGCIIDIHLRLFVFINWSRYNFNENAEFELYALQPCCASTTDAFNVLCIRKKSTVRRVDLPSHRPPTSRAHCDCRASSCFYYGPVTHHNFILFPIDK